MKSYTFYLIRHGRSVANDRNRIVGSTDSPLSEKGRELLRETSVFLEENPVEAVFCSPLSRASETAGILYPQKPPIVIEGLREYGFGAYEDSDYETLSENGRISGEAFLRKCASAEGAEDERAFCDRVFAAFAKIVEGCMRSGVRRAALVTHGVVIMTLMYTFAYPKRASLFDWACGNGAGYVLKTNSSLWMRDRIVEAVAALSCPEENNR